MVETIFMGVFMDSHIYNMGYFYSLQ